MERLFALVDFVKLDLLAMGREAFAAEIKRLRRHDLTLLAEKVETHEDYEFCARAGCELFQGYFFCRPELVSGQRVDANKLALLELLAALQDPAVDLSDLERMIARDLGLSYRLLRYINSAFFGLRQQVRSIGQALALLGTETLKHWAALSVFASIDNKPKELTVTALIRARFCELAWRERHRDAGAELFTLGLFSVIDALMDTPIDEVIAKIPFPDDMRAALVAHSGEKGALLTCITALEAGDFEAAEAIVPHAGELHVTSLVWANSAADPLYADAATTA
jgi:EAL and modified HD-GYP domain-containing signal transduction protein